MAFRVDVSRPQWQRPALDDVVGVYVVGGQVRRYSRWVSQRLERSGARGYWYGTPNRIAEPNTLAVAWCLNAWTLGLDGVVPWQTIGRPTAWSEPHELALLYPGGDSEPALPSLRLMAFTRAQQDVEYLNALVASAAIPRTTLEREVRERLGFGSPSTEPPTSSALQSLRDAVALALERSSPAPTRN
jgi:hypothetical protein